MKSLKFILIITGAIFALCVVFFFVQFTQALSIALHMSDITAEDATIEEHLGATIPKELIFTDTTGKQVTLQSLFINNRPTILVPVYYTCPRLCSMTLNGFSEMLKELKLKLGNDFNVITFSFNDNETFKSAGEKATKYQQTVVEQHPSAATDWHFLVGSPEVIASLMKSIGFSYKTSGTEIAHSAGFLVLSPMGTINRYFYGIQYDPEHVRFALVEASEGKIGNTIDKVLLYCFQFDPSVGRYSLAIMNVVRVVSLTGLGILTFVLLNFLIKKKKRRGDNAHA